MTRLLRWAFLASGVWVIGVAMAFAAGDAPSHPNVVVVLTDDQGWGDLSLNGNPNLKTPRIDSLAHDGARFSRFFVQPVCSPTRAEFLTGRWHPRGSVVNVTEGGERLDLDERTIADAFRTAGYATGCFGKWHNGTQYPYHPLGRGFDEYFGFTSGHWGDYFDAPLDHNGNDTQGKGFLTDEITDRAIGFLQANRRVGRPSFCYLALNTPHTPMQVPDAYWKRFENAAIEPVGRGENPAHTRAALAMCENIDDNVGRLLDALTAEGLAENTIVVFFCDNGPNGTRWNGGMKGVKGSTDEGGVRSPLLIRWPAKIKPDTVVTPIAGAIDLYPTLIDLAGVRPAGDKPFDGMSFKRWLVDGEIDAPNRVLFSHWNKQTSARDQRFRLSADGKLYDMIADPSQTKDRAGDFPDDARRLATAIDRWRQDVFDGMTKADARPFPVGYQAFPRSVLPARDGKGMGGIRRSAGAPNCSYFTHWSKKDDAIEWHIEVAKAGRYEAFVRYTCPQSEIGSKIELKFGDAAWTGTITESHDPPLRGPENDRVPRTSESPMKNFRRMSLGVAEVNSQTGVLRLTATQIAASTVADIEAVELVLLDGK